MSIRREEVQEVMSAFLGKPFILEHPFYVDRVWALLYEGERRSKDLSELFVQLGEALFQEMYALTAGSMQIPDEHGQRRVSMSELDDLADALMELLFSRFSRTLGSFERLNDFAMHHTSLAALKFLYIYYQPWASPMNIDIYKRIIRENFPPEQYQSWLRD